MAMFKNLIYEWAYKFNADCGDNTNSVFGFKDVLQTCSGSTVFLSMHQRLIKI